MIARSLLLVFVTIFAGCYRYTPVQLGSVPAGTEVRLHLSDEGAQRIESLTAARQRQVTGTLERWAEEDVVVSVPVPPAQGLVDRGLRYRVILMPGEIVSIDVREGHRSRTIALTAGSIALLTVALVSAFSGVFGGYRDPPVDGPSDTLLPAWLRVFP